MESSGVNGVRGPEVNHQGYPYQGYPQPYPTKQPPGDPSLRPGIPHSNSFPPHLRPGGPPGPPGPGGHQGQWGLPPRAPSPYGSQSNSQHPSYGYRPPTPQQVQNNVRPAYPEQYPQYRYPPHSNNAPSPISSPGPQQPPGHSLENHQHQQPPTNGTGPGGPIGDQGHSSDTASPGPTHQQAATPAKRPSPSPTGSSGSTSSQPMSPAIGNVGAPARPSSRQDVPPQHGQQSSLGPPPQGPYGQGPMPPPHLGSYPPGKGVPGYHPHGQHYPPTASQGAPGSYSPQRPQAPTGQFAAYPPQQPGLAGPPVSQPYGGSVPPRPGPPGQYGQYPGYGHPPGQYPQQWGNKPGIAQPPIQQPPVTPRPAAASQPAQYLRHQLQQKVGYPNQPHTGNPALTPPHPGYPTSGGNLLSPTPQHPPSPGPNVGSAQITVTGPDGAGIDEASQQSTLSNASQASGDDGPPTPRSRPGATPLGFPGSHPATPSSGTAPSPGMVHDDYNDVNSPGPGWGRANASPRATLSEGIQRLYDFDDHPERRPFVENLLRFMEEEGHAITSCPSISKNPLDLFRLYLMVRERGGFIEVTKNKTWKDIAGLLGIGASSSAAYTLRKHYTRNLLRWECRFDRGGIDPNPIISQYETTSHKKKKNAEQAAIPPAPHVDGYPGHPMGHPVPHPGQPGPHPAPHPGHQPPTHPGYPGYPHPGAPVGEYHGHPPPVPHGAHHPPARGPPPTPGDNISASNPFDDMPSGANVQNYPRPPGPGVSSTNYAPGFAPAGHAPRAPHPQGYGAQGPFPPYGADQPYKAAPPTPAPVSQEYSSVPNTQSQYPPPPSSYTLPTRTLYPPYGAPAQGSAPPESAPHQPVSQPGHMDPAGFRYPTPAQGVLPAYQQIPASASPAPSASPGLAPTRAMSPAPATPGPSPSPAPMSHTPLPAQLPGPAQSVPGHPAAEMNGPSADVYQRGGLRQLLSAPNQPQQQQSMQMSSQSLADRLQGYPHAGSPKPMSQASRPSLTPMQPIMPPAAGGSQPTPINQQPYQQYGQQPRPQAMGWRPPMQGQPGPGPAPQYPQTGPGMVGQGAQGPPHWGAQHQRPPSQGPPGAPWDQQYQPRPGSAGPGQQAPSPAWMQSQVRPMPPQRGARPEPSMKGQYPPMNQQGPSARGPVPPPLSSQFGRREIVFPPDSVEATQPILMKKRRLVKQDVAPVEGWRLMMALKSGLLAETTWALDVLNVLLYDDHSVVFFGLGNMPGLLDLLLDYARVYLHKIFGLFSDIDSHQKTKESKESEWWMPRRRKTDDDVDLGEIKPKDLVGAQLRLLNCNPNSRLAQPLKVESDVSSLLVSDRRRDWDNFSSGDVDIEELRTIVTHVECDVTYSRFVRVTADVKKETEPVVVVKQEVQEPEAPVQEEVKLPPKKGKNNVKKGKSLEDILARIKKEPVVETPPAPVDEKVQENIELTNGLDCEIKEDPIAVKETKPEVKVEIDFEVDVNGGERLVVRDETGRFKRKAEVLEDECHSRDEPCLNVQSESQEALGRRCVTILNILRSLTFVPGNEREFVNHSGFLKLIGRVLLLNHEHLPKPRSQRHYEKDDEGEIQEQSSTLGSNDDWWSDVLVHSREAALVMLANISGYLDLNQFHEEVSRPVLNGLLHWATCNSAEAQDPFPWIGANSSSLLSPQRLALETLCKLCVIENNPDLILSTPPIERIEVLCGLLSKWLCRSEDQVRRELSLNLIYYFSAASEGVAWLIASQSATFPQLLSFIEQAESNAMTIASQHGINALRDNPDAMGTSLDMLRRAASSVMNLAKHELARPLLARQELRLVNLVMSQILDQGVASLLSQALFICSDVPRETASDDSS